MLRVPTLALAAAACGDAVPPIPPPPQLISANSAQAATVGAVFAYDATKAGTAFSGAGLAYAVALTAPSRGLTASGGLVSGLPNSPGVVRATITATDAMGRMMSQTFPIAIFAPGVRSPVLPTVSFAYADATNPLPPHFVNPGPGGPVIGTDNTPPDNAITNAGATLGRVLFYDRRLSANDQVACASCHLQSRGFSDTARFSRGFLGGLTSRHSMGLANARFYQRGRFFWDERAPSAEDQALRPIQDPVEMGLALPDLIAKLEATPFYRPLFSAAFGSPEITTNRVARALAQFVRSLRSSGSRFDASFPQPPPGPPGVPLSTLEQQGLQLFNSPAAGCSPCHTTHAHVSDNVHNTGLDSVITDPGAGNGRFKAPSLRNVAIRAPYMHDGRFTTLAQVVEFYDSGVKLNPGLDGRLRNQDGTVRRLNLTQAQRDALVAFLATLTDSAFLTAPKFSNPFPP